MAILTKRRAKSELPEVTTDRGIVATRPSQSLTSNITGRPSGVQGDLFRPSGGASPRGASTSLTNASARPSALLNSAVRGVVPTTTSTSPKGLTGGSKSTALTQKPVGSSRPTLTKKTVTSGGDKGLTSKIGSALTGAAAGVAGKKVYDTLFGKDSTQKSGSASKDGAGDVKKQGVIDKAIDSVVKKIDDVVKGAPPAPKKPADPVKKPPATKPVGTAPKSAETPAKSIGKVKGKSEGSRGIKTGTAATDPTMKANEDGTYTQTMDDGSTITFDADGNVISSTEATDGEAGGTVTNDDGSTTDANGNTTFTYDDGSTVTVDSDGNVVSSTNSEGLSVFEKESDAVGSDSNENLDGVTDEEGNVTYTLDDGSTITLDASGEVVSSTDSYGDNVDLNDTDDTTEEEQDTSQTFEDEDGNLYDYEGNLVYDSSAGMFVTDDGYEDYYSDDEVIEDEAVTDEVVDDDETYSEDDYTYSDDDYTYEDEDYYDDSSYEDDGDEYYDFRRGGLTTMKKRGGQVRHFETGGYSDTDEEVQDFQNVNYNYGENDDPGLLTGDMSLYNTGALRNTYTTANSEDDGFYTEFFDDGSYIYYYPDGSSVTYDSDGRVYEVGGNTQGNSQADQSEDVLSQEDIDLYNQLGKRVSTNEDELRPLLRRPFYSNLQLSQEDIDLYNQIGDRVRTNNTASDTFDAGNRQVFDDGSSIETFDDGSTITYDSDGKIYKTSGAYETSVDDEGNLTVTDDYGNIVGVYDPSGNVIPVGGGRITNVGSGDAGNIRRTDDRTPAQKAKDDLRKAAGEKGDQNRIKDFIDSITGSDYLGAGAAGAVLGLLSGDMFGGSSGERNAGIDMSKLAIPQRTTDFGIGPAKYATYNEYSARDQMPDLYGDELYRNLNAPGFNPVREGDYDKPVEAVEEEDIATGMAEGGEVKDYDGTYFTFGRVVDPLENLRNPMRAKQNQMSDMGDDNAEPMRKGGLPSLSNVPMTGGRLDFRQGSAVHGPGDGQSDDIPAMLADGEYVFDAETVAQIGNGSTKAGAKALDKFRENIRQHKRSAPLNKIPPKTKALTSYLKKGN